MRWFGGSSHVQYMFHHNFLPCFSNYTLWSQKLKIRPNLSEWNCEQIFFSLPMSSSWCDLCNEGVNKVTRRKHFLLQKCFLRECPCVGNVSIIHRDHLVYFRFMESYWLFQLMANKANWSLKKKSKVSRQILLFLASFRKLLLSWSRVKW